MKKLWMWILSFFSKKMAIEKILINAPGVKEEKVLTDESRRVKMVHKLHHGHFGTFRPVRPVMLFGKRVSLGTPLSVRQKWFNTPGSDEFVKIKRNHVL